MKGNGWMHDFIAVFGEDVACIGIYINSNELNVKETGEMEKAF